MWGETYIFILTRLVWFANYVCNQNLVATTAKYRVLLKAHSFAPVSGPYLPEAIDVTN